MLSVIGDWVVLFYFILLFLCGSCNQKAVVRTSLRGRWILAGFPLQAEKSSTCSRLGVV
ncbi:hypothetical protein M758_UG220100 [Ceratodon purpureus]|nr:hypothetical protein M758_UG220100 [Ceratodon purpureus]